MNFDQKKFVVDIGWQLILNNLSVRAQDLLRHAGLPRDLFSQKTPTLATAEYFRLWESLEHFVDDPAFPIRVVEASPVEAFGPPMFATLCSPNLKVAAERLAQYKPLIGPLRLDAEQNNKGDLELTLGGLPIEATPPSSFIAMELVFLVNLARLGTRERIVPKRVISAAPLKARDAFDEYLGVHVQSGDQSRVIFRAHDASKPFLSANAGMFSVFEPELRKRLDDLNPDDGFKDRVRACLMEALASGQYAMADVADRLAVSTRTLQRRLSSEGTNFQRELSKLRENLARYYLAETEYSSAEISFLLGYDDPNSFIRAFNGWTGDTPERLRTELRVN